MNEQKTIHKKIPKGWIQISEHCFMDEKGNPHSRIKTTHTLVYANKREKILKFIKKHKEERRLYAAKYRKKNPEKKKASNKIASLRFGDCIKRAIRIRKKIKYHKNKKSRPKGLTVRCDLGDHKLCRGSHGCTCKCHKNT